jgi:hypothetical protein
MTAPRPGARAYHRHGHGPVKRALPFLLERVADAGVPDAALSPVEAAARAWRREAEADLGGDLAATARALLDAATGTVILLASLDRYVFQLAEAGRLVNRKSRRAFPVLDSRLRLADSLARQLLALGLQRRAAPPPSLTEYVATQYGTPTRPRDAAEAPPDAAPEDDASRGAGEP